MPASLYGISNSNRNFSDPYYWGKNQFNSSFPISLACYMRDNHLDPVYLTLAPAKKVALSTITVSKLFNTDRPNNQLYFAFESRYEPFSYLAHDLLKPIDVVVSDETNFHSRALEIKLTTIPDNTTSRKAEENYGCELVVRNPTTRYMALSMIDACQKHKGQILNIFEPACHAIRNWDSTAEILSNLRNLNQALENFVEGFKDLQRPILLQPIWKTLGPSSQLAENCLDIFVWSDFSLARMMLDMCLHTDQGITRPQRAVIRLCRFLYEASRGRVYQDPIYDGMTYGTLNDKEFALSGTKTNLYMKSERLKKPIITKNAIREIILGGGQKYLSPERRFDAILYFSNDLFD